MQPTCSEVSEGIEQQELPMAVSEDEFFNESSESSNNFREFDPTSDGNVSEQDETRVSCEGSRSVRKLTAQQQIQTMSSVVDFKKEGFSCKIRVYLEGSRHGLLISS